MGKLDENKLTNNKVANLVSYFGLLLSPEGPVGFQIHLVSHSLVSKYRVGITTGADAFCDFVIFTFSVSCIS